MDSYTFHVSLPGHGRVWRKLELTAESTLEDLHHMIQNAFEFDNDHLYSFFMSGKAWDTATEYNLPEGADPWGFDLFDDDDEDDDDELPDEADLAESLFGLPSLPASSDQEELAMPTPEQARAMFAELKKNPEAREKFIQAMSNEMGLPPLMAQMLISNMESMFGNLSDQELDALLNMDDEAIGGGMFGGDEAGDVRTTQLSTLDLKKGKKFLYLFDYGDEWRFTVKVDAINKNIDPEQEYPRLVEEVGKAPQQYPNWDEDDEEWDED